MNLTKDQSPQVLSSFGYEIDRSFKFKIRDEKTPSASINPKNGKIKDFGSGWMGDIVDFLTTFENLSQKEAFAKVEDILNLNHDKFKNFTKIKIKSNQAQSFISQDLINNFLNQRKENFNRFWELLSQTMPTISKEKKREIAEIYEIGYSKQSDRLIMPIKDENGNCLTFWKYSPKPSIFIGEDGKAITLPKVMFSKNRNRTIFNLKDIEKFSKNSEPIFIVEGEKDCLNALASGYNAITLGSASKNIDEKFLHYFKNKYIVIAYDFDESGKNGAEMLQNQLKSVAKEIEIIDWQNITKKLGFNQNLQKGFDFTDFLKEIDKKNKIIENQLY